MLSIPISFEKGHGVFVCVCHRSCCVSRVCAENALMTPTPKRQTLFLLGNETGIGKKEKKNRKATWHGHPPHDMRDKEADVRTRSCQSKEREKGLLFTGERNEGFSFKGSREEWRRGLSSSGSGRDRGRGLGARRSEAAIGRAKPSNDDEARGKRRGGGGATKTNIGLFLQATRSPKRLEGTPDLLSGESRPHQEVHSDWGSRLGDSRAS